MVPSNIEKHLLTHAAVEDAAVVGRPHDVDGELPTAFVVVRAGHSVTADELVRFIDGQYHLICISFSVGLTRLTGQTERVADEERLRGGVRFTGRIPRNDLGKIVRRQLMQMIPTDKYNESHF